MWQKVQKWHLLIDHRVALSDAIVEELSANGADIVAFQSDASSLFGF